MHMESRITFITLGVADMGRSIRFYRDGLGWWTAADDGADFALFRTLGTRLALYPHDKLAQDIGLEVSAGASGFAGITLGHNVRSKDEVRAGLAAAEFAGGRLLKSPQDTPWGGYSGYFADPDGYVWEVAWAGKGWHVAADGMLYGGSLGEPAAP
jgi:uncharacterized protein